MIKKKEKNATDDAFLLADIHVPVIVCDYHKGTLSFVNEKFLQLTGLSKEECFGMPVREFNKWLHEADLELFEKQVVTLLREACKDHITSPSDKLCYSFNYRLKTRDGYRPVLMQSSVTAWDKYLFPEQTLNILSDLTNHKKDQKIILSIKVLSEGDSAWRTVLVEEFFREPTMLATREKKIMKLMLEDRSATEIADALMMNPHTVRTHWRNILQKTGCHTQKKLKELALTEGWI